MKSFLLALIFGLIISTTVAQDWSTIKSSQAPVLVLTDEFETPYPQALATIGWEDGIHISSDGLHLYCTYVPIDILSFSLNSELPNEWVTNYDRGAPYFGMDLVTNPVESDEWMQSDILYATRNTTEDPFTTWTLSNMGRAIFTEGAPSPVFSDASTVEMMLFTGIENPTNNMDIWMIENTTPNPSGIGAALPAPVNTTLQEDNPNLTRINADSLVLFYDSEELAGEGSHDIWVSTSGDNGTTWSMPINVSTINTSSKEHQPFLHFDSETGKYLLYFSAYHTDNKLAIYRAEFGGGASWDNWGTPELVIAAGTTAGIGEPTLTTNGDLSFVVVYADPDVNSIYNRFDADPWMMEKKTFVTSLDNKGTSYDITVFPNPANSTITISCTDVIEKIYLYSLTGTLLKTSTHSELTIEELSIGSYLIVIEGEHGKHTTSFHKIP